MQNHSTTQQLSLFLSDAFTTLHQLDTIYLDISKAFDTVCHAHLLHKLSNISGNLWIWFKEYRSQFVYQQYSIISPSCIMNHYCGSEGSFTGNIAASH